MLRWIQFSLISATLLATTAGYAATGYIDTPDECYLLEKVTGNQIYLKAAGKCEGRPGRAYAEASGTVRVFLDGNFWREQELTPLAIPDIEASLKKAQKLESTLKIPQNIHASSMVKEAEKLNSVYQSPKFQKQLNDEAERLKKEVFKVQPGEYYSEVPKQGKTAAAKLAGDERVYLFISSSMPMATIRNYVASVARFRDDNIVIVLRGFVGGMSKIGPTVQFTSAALKENPLCEGRDCTMHPVSFVIDPLLFRRYGVMRVPAVVFAKGVTPAAPEGSEGDLANSVSSSSTIYGDASLEYMLDKIRQDTGSASLKGLLAKR